MVILEIVLLLIVVNSLAFTNQEKPTQLPSESSKWETIRLHNLYYSDKTPHLKKLVENPAIENYFVTRPRRFGKTMFLDMMKNFFEGKEELFRGLSIHQHGNIISHFAKGIATSNSVKWLKFPVIMIDFVAIGNFLTREQFQYRYNVVCLEPYAIRYNITYETVDHLSLASIIIKIHDITQKKVIVLVDEYDALVQRQILKKNYEWASYFLDFTEQFLGEIKSSRNFIGMAFVTGISRLTLASLESGANNFVDITYKPELATAFGITVEELENNMNPYLEEVAKSLNKPTNEVKKCILSWYNGYNFDKEDLSDKNRVLNPVSTIKCLNEKKLESYWIKTSSMKLVVEEFYKNYHKFTKETFIGGLYINIGIAFKTFNPLESIDLPSFLLSYGYLTITKYNPKNKQIQLKYPNEEVKRSIQDALISYVPWRKCNLNECLKENEELAKAMRYAHTIGIINIFRNHFFRDFLPPSGGKATPDEITRRLHFTFEAGGIQYREGIQFKKDLQLNDDGGDIDFLTIGLPINYAISVKCGTEGTAFNAMMQMMKYMRESPISLDNAMRAEGVNTTSVYFLGLGFSYDKGGKLKDWLAVKYNGLQSNIDLDTVEAESEDMKEKFIQEYNITNS